MESAWGREGGLSSHPKIPGPTLWMSSKGRMRGAWLSLRIASGTPSDPARSLPVLPLPEAHSLLFGPPGAKGILYKFKSDYAMPHNPQASATFFSFGDCTSTFKGALVWNLQTRLPRPLLLKVSVFPSIKWVHDDVLATVSPGPNPSWNSTGSTGGISTFSFPLSFFD